MSRFVLKTASVLLLSAGAALAQAPSIVHNPAMAPGAQPQNAAAYPYGAQNIRHAFTGGRIASNGAPIQVQENETASFANIPAGM